MYHWAQSRWTKPCGYVKAHSGLLKKPKLKNYIAKINSSDNRLRLSVAMHSLFPVICNGEITENREAVWFHIKEKAKERFWGSQWSAGVAPLLILKYKKFIQLSKGKWRFYVNFFPPKRAVAGWKCTRKNFISNRFKIL